MVIRSIRVLSLAKVMGVMYALIGLLIGLFFSLFSLLGAAFSSALDQSSGEAWLGALFGVGAVILLPVIYGCLGFLGGLISSAVYNLVARLVGGIELETG